MANAPSPGQSEALQHAGRKLSGQATRDAAERGALQRGLDRVVQCCAAQPLQSSGPGEVLVHGEFAVGGYALRQETDVAAHVDLSMQVATEHPHVAGVGYQHAGEQLHQRDLPAPLIPSRPRRSPLCSCRLPRRGDVATACHKRAVGRAARFHVRAGYRARTALRSLLCSGHARTTLAMIRLGVDTGGTSRISSCSRPAVSCACTRCCRRRTRPKRRSCRVSMGRPRATAAGARFDGRDQCRARRQGRAHAVRHQSRLCRPADDRSPAVCRAVRVAAGAGRTAGAAGVVHRDRRASRRVGRTRRTAERRRSRRPGGLQRGSNPRQSPSTCCSISIRHSSGVVAALPEDVRLALPGAAGDPRNERGMATWLNGSVRACRLPAAARRGPAGCAGIGDAEPGDTAAAAQAAGQAVRMLLSGPPGWSRHTRSAA